MNHKNQKAYELPVQGNYGLYVGGGIAATGGLIAVGTGTALVLKNYNIIAAQLSIPGLQYSALAGLMLMAISIHAMTWKVFEKNKGLLNIQKSILNKKDDELEEALIIEQVVGMAISLTSTLLFSLACCSTSNALGATLSPMINNQLLTVAIKTILSGAAGAGLGALMGHMLAEAYFVGHSKNAGLSDEQYNKLHNDNQRIPQDQRKICAITGGACTAIATASSQLLAMFMGVATNSFIASTCGFVILSGLMSTQFLLRAVEKIETNPIREI